jgi:hypothetical protein
MVPLAPDQEYRNVQREMAAEWLKLADAVLHARALEAFLCKQIDSGLNNGVPRIFGRSDHGFPRI